MSADFTPVKEDPAEYRGVHLQDLRTEKERKRDWIHPIFLYTPDEKDQLGLINFKLNQIVNVYEHNMSDFEFNAKKIIKHYKRYYGDTSFGLYTIGQTIAFRVYKGQEEPFILPLFKFLVNYTMLIIPITVGNDMHDWQPWVPYQWTADGWMKRIDKYIEMARPLANMRKICECIEMAKYLMNLWVAKAGSRQALSISNNEFIEVMKRNEEAYKSITCSFEIPDDISPTDLESMTAKRTSDLLNFIGEQRDLSISVYARNKLFNPAQFREYAVHMCHKPDLSGNTIPYTYPTNIIMGIKDIRAHVVDASGGRKAEITKLNVSDAGTLERALMMMMSPVRFVDNDWECDSKHYRHRYIGGVNDLMKLDGRVATLDQKSDEYFIIDPNNTKLIGKTLLLKSPITCTHPHRKDGVICSACYGKLMASLNCDVHIGRVAAAESADEIEQKLLSAKHALLTDTARVEFDEVFYQYFDLGNGIISFNSAMVDSSMDDDPSSDFRHLYFEFYPKTMGKHQDGESRHMDRSFQEITIYDDRDESHITIAEENGATLYLSPEFNDNNFLPMMNYRDMKDVIRIPFTDIIDNGKVLTQVLFEFGYRNSEIASPLLTLEKIMFNCKTINSFGTYNACMDTLIPLFVKGGIHIPDYQTELLVSQMITTPDGDMVDWNNPNPEYVFNSINKSIQKNKAALTSILYQESGQQIAGAYGTYDKFGVSPYDHFIMARGDNSPWA